ncbi:MAG: hypothetical protein FWF01_02045 [Alphaproteobacteria bacterium]|nr:hypothetical protein [Alphaproteobacteria bacterium]
MLGNTKAIVLSMFLVVGLTACQSSDSGRDLKGLSSADLISRKVESLQNEVKVMQVVQQRSATEMQQIREQTMGSISRYYENIAAINARLQIGTTAGNPMLKERWRSANLQLDVIASDINAMRRLSTQINTDAALAGFIRDSVNLTMGISGATEEDHKTLRAIADETERSVAFSRRMVDDLNFEISRQEGYIASQKRNLTDLAMVINQGSGREQDLDWSTAVRTAQNANRIERAPPVQVVRAVELPAPAPVARATPAPTRTATVTAPVAPRQQPAAQPAPARAATPAATAPAPATPAPRRQPAARTVASADAQKPIVQIDFSVGQAKYETQLFEAVQKSLDNNPEAKFTLVGNEGAEADVNKVAEVLMEMGMPRERILTRFQAGLASSSQIAVYERQ